MDGAMPLHNHMTSIYPPGNPVTPANGKGIPVYPGAAHHPGYTAPTAHISYPVSTLVPGSMGFGASTAAEQGTSGTDGTAPRRVNPGSSTGPIRSTSTTITTATSSAGVARSSSPSSAPGASERPRAEEGPGEESKDIPTACAFFLKTGTCAYGDKCKFSHPLDKVPIIHFNTLGLPLRPGEPDCAFYMKTLRCGFGASCKFNHPEAYWNMMPLVAPGQVAHYLQTPPMWPPMMPHAFAGTPHMPGMAMVSPATVPSSPDRPGMLPRQPFTFMGDSSPMARAGSLPMHMAPMMPMHMGAHSPHHAGPPPRRPPLASPASDLDLATEGLQSIALNKEAHRGQPPSAPATTAPSQTSAKTTADAVEARH